MFCERLDGLALPHARQTNRLAECLQLVAQALGGNAGARLAERLSLPTSPTSLLRRLRQSPTPPSTSPRVVGIDDWAYTRGQRYGTILVDLEQHRVLDLLPDRTTATVANWLRSQPGIQVVSRDRAGAYAEAVRLGAPQAEQVADRWHLLHNLTEAVQRVVEQHHRSWRDVVREAKVVPVPLPPVVDAPPSAVERRRQARRERQQARCAEVLQLRAAGVSIQGIAVRLQMHRRQVRQWIRLGEPPPRTAPKRRTSELDSYAPFLRQRWEEGCRNAAQLWQELRQQGFPGSASRVRQWIRQHHRPASRRTATPAPMPIPAVSPRQITWVLLEGPRAVKEITQTLVQQFRQRVPEVDHAVQLAKQFAELLREKRENGLEDWLRQAEESGLATFAAGVRRDLAAVQGAFRLPWSQGQVEGQVNRLKTLKRQMYGRAGFALLRSRTLLGQSPSAAICGGGCVVHQKRRRTQL